MVLLVLSCWPCLASVGAWSSRAAGDGTRSHPIAQLIGLSAAWGERSGSVGGHRPVYQRSESLLRTNDGVPASPARRPHRPRRRVVPGRQSGPNPAHTRQVLRWEATETLDQWPRGATPQGPVLFPPAPSSARPPRRELTSARRRPTVAATPEN